MSRASGFRLALGAVLALAAGLAGSAARADAVVHWWQVMDKATGGSFRLDRARTPLATRVEARMALAMFEAADAVDRRYASFLGLPKAVRGVDEEAAVDAAARDVLLASLPDTAPAVEAAYAEALATRPEGEARRLGIATGQAAAKAAMQAGGLDPARPPQPYRPVTPAGVWQPTELIVIPDYYLSFRPWFLSRVDALRPPPPPPLGSATYVRSLQETQRLGARDSRERTPEQTRSARFWVADDEDALLRQIADRPGRSLVQNARLYARLAMAEDDAFTAVFDAKLHYKAWRPITAIRNADRDPSLATTRDPAWEPLLRTPNHPEYPCGHCIHAAVVAAVLAAEDGMTPDERFTFTAASMPGYAQHLTLEESTEACSMSRIYGGVHFRFSNDVAVAMGRRLGRLAIERFAPPVS